MSSGALIVVGTGIRGIGQLTFEAAGWITQADRVAYCVSDPVTEVWIQQRARSFEDLYALYGNDKPRQETYGQMVAALTGPAREGQTVCGVFYGHPGVFADPPHEAIRVLRAEGIPAMMLPGVSAADCLFADLGVDPGTVGCQEVEATELLLSGRPLLTDSHVVIWQVGCVGDLGFRFGGFDNDDNRQVLLAYLGRFYPPEHQVTHYSAAQYPVCGPLVRTLALRDLHDEYLTGVSTLYVPPVAPPATDPAMADRLNLHRPRPRTDRAPRNSAPAHLDRYLPTRENSALAAYLARLASDPAALGEFMREPEEAVAALTGLGDDERAALLSGDAGAIRMAMKDTAPTKGTQTPSGAPEERGETKPHQHTAD
ncbi:SAM-dependent methyltransferase [Streptomyces sp. NPDC059788]|uniref:SAM-dependent methyltransferase n=1 Tax=Streptomyces sp. NPDC059788 TaxID=3346948 RepID=UPI003646721D